MMLMDILHNNVLVTPLRGPQNTVGTVTTSYVDVSPAERVQFAAYIGNIPTGGTVNFELRQATTSGGLGAKQIAGGSITALLDADDNKLVSIDLHTHALDFNNGYTFVACRFLATDTIVAGAWATQYFIRHGGDAQPAAYAQQVAVY